MSKLPNQLKYRSFQVVVLDSGDFYFSYKFNRKEICLEKCLNGFDVAIYDDNQGLLEPKVCTNSDGSETAKSIVARAVSIADKFYQDYK